MPRPQYNLHFILSTPYNAEEKVDRSTQLARTWLRMSHAALIDKILFSVVSRLNDESRLVRDRSPVLS